MKLDPNTRKALDVIIEALPLPHSNKDEIRAELDAPEEEKKPTPPPARTPVI